MARQVSGMKRKTLFIQPAMWERLEKLSARDGVSVSDLVRRAIVEFLRKEEKDV